MIRHTCNTLGVPRNSCGNFRGGLKAQQWQLRTELQGTAIGTLVLFLQWVWPGQHKLPGHETYSQPQAFSPDTILRATALVTLQPRGQMGHCGTATWLLEKASSHRNSTEKLLPVFPPELTMLIFPLQIKKGMLLRPPNTRMVPAGNSWVHH